MKVTLQQLRALQRLAETGSFSEAAHLSGLTQSALSQQLKRLEDELGQTLVIRARPRAYLSAAGKAVLASAQKIHDELQALQTHFALLDKGPLTGSLRIAATSMSLIYVLGDLCEAFIEKYPGVDLVFTAVETAEAAIRRVLAGSSDLAFGPVGQPRRQLSSVPLARTDHVFVVSKKHPLARLASVTLDDLREHPFVLFQKGSGTRALTDRLFSPAGGYASVVSESNDVQFIKRIVAMGKGVAFMPVYALSDTMAQADLRLLPCNFEPVQLEIGIVHRRDVQMHSIELFKALCLDLRGPSLFHFSAQSMAWEWAVRGSVSTEGCVAANARTSWQPKSPGPQCLPTLQPG